MTKELMSSVRVVMLLIAVALGTAGLISLFKQKPSEVPVEKTPVELDLTDTCLIDEGLCEDGGTSE